MTRRWLHHAHVLRLPALLRRHLRRGFYDHVFLGWQAPYPLLSAPVLLGTVGGVLLLVGTSGLVRESSPVRRRRPAHLLGGDSRCSCCCRWWR